MSFLFFPVEQEANKSNWQRDKEYTFSASLQTTLMCFWKKAVLILLSVNNMHHELPGRLIFWMAQLLFLYCCAVLAATNDENVLNKFNLASGKAQMN